MTKVHLNYKVNGQPANKALCANNRRGYDYVPRLAFPKEFRMVPASERCSHCVNIYLDRRNALRRKKGLPPVLTPFENQDHN